MKKVTPVESLFIFLFYYKYIYTYIHIRTLVFSKHPMMKKADGLRPTLVVSIGRDTDKNLVYWSFCSTLKKLKKTLIIYIYFFKFIFLSHLYTWFYFITMLRVELAIQGQYKIFGHCRHDTKNQ